MRGVKALVASPVIPEPQRGRRELTPASCLLTFTHQSTIHNPHITHINKNNKEVFKVPGTLACSARKIESKGGDKMGDTNFWSSSQDYQLSQSTSST